MSKYFRLWIAHTRTRMTGSKLEPAKVRAETEEYTEGNKGCNSCKESNLIVPWTSAG